MVAVDCPIWGTEATRAGGTGDFGLFSSDRAGGKYELTGTAEAIIQSGDSSAFSEEQRRAITNEIFLANLNGIIPRFTSQSLGDLTYRPLGSLERYNRFLKRFSELHPNLGEFVDASSTWWEDGQLFASAIDLPDAEPDHYRQPLQWLVDASVQKGHFIRKAGLEGQISISAEGWQYIEDLGAATSSSDRVFVAMWFGDSELRTLYLDHIKPAIERAGYEPVRIDDTEHNEKIDDQILAEIRKARAVVVDMTCGLAKPENWGNSELVGAPRGGVFFEAGFARGLNLPVIWTVRADIADVENVVHFDVRQYNQIRWPRDFGDFAERLQARIEATLGTGSRRKP